MNELEPFQNEDKLAVNGTGEMRKGSRAAVGAVQRAASQLVSAAWRAPGSSQPHVRGCLLQRLHTASSRATSDAPSRGTTRSSMIVRTCTGPRCLVGAGSLDQLKAPARSHSHGGVRRASSGAKSMKRYSKLEDKDVAFFEQVLGKTGVITDCDDLVPYNTDWMKKYYGQSKLALRPKTTEQVAEAHILKRISIVNMLRR